MEMKILKKKTVSNNDDDAIVLKIAEGLCKGWSDYEITNKINEIHKVGANSQQIQNILSPLAESFGFQSEKKGLFKNYTTAGLRPDYYKKISSQSGILMEVERGKTVANNMDILDLWKCHICQEANYLFLIVPMVRQTKAGKDDIIFNKVIERLSPFFDEQNYINIDAVFIFRY